MLMVLEVCSKREAKELIDDGLAGSRNLNFMKAALTKVKSSEQ